MPAPLISIKNLSYKFDKIDVLKDISLEFKKNKFYAIVGPNGAGKSTLIKLLLGIYKTKKNIIKIQKDLRFGYVPQHIELPRTMPITTHQFLKTWHPKLYDDAFENHAKLTGIKHKYKTSIHGLSGGELKRLLITNALIHKPDILILDEPFAGIDVKGQEQIFKILETVQKEYNCTIILISHNLSLILPKIDEIILLNKTICCGGKPEKVKSHHHFENLFGPHQ